MISGNTGNIHLFLEKYKVIRRETVYAELSMAEPGAPPVLKEIPA